MANEIYHIKYHNMSVKKNVIHDIGKSKKKTRKLFIM